MASEFAASDGRTAEQQHGLDDDDLQESLAGLSRLAPARLSLDSLLTRVAHYAVQAIPGADGAGLTLLEAGRGNTLVATAAFVSEIDAMQYGIGQGPCVTAFSEGRTIISGSLGSDPRWRQFGGRVARMGVHSAVSLPLLTPEGVVGAMNVYARAKHAFDERAAELGELFAGPAAIAVENAHMLERARRLALHLQVTLDTRMVIERAVGIMMSRSGIDEVEALDRLKTLSQHEHEKLVVIAQNLVDEAVRRARSQRHG